MLAGCTGPAEPPAASAEDAAARPAEPVTATPGAPRTLIADADPVAAAVSTSRALFASSPVVVVADSADPAAQLLGASAAVGLGVPLLLGVSSLPGSGGEPDDVLSPELDRLGVSSVLAVGAGAADAVPGNDPTRTVVAVATTAPAVEAATGLTFSTADPVPADGSVAAVAALDPGQPAALTPAAATSPADVSSGASATASARPSSSPTSSADGELPEVARPAPLDDVLVLASGGSESLAGVATARAAGADVLLTGGTTDPRASPDVVTALGAGPAAVVVLGSDFGVEAGLDWKLDTAATGTQLPGGGQLLFPQHMLVALYGTPGTGALGILGEQDLPGAVQRAQALAAPYRDLVDATVVPTFEIIATVASGSAGGDGNYSNEIDPGTLRPWVEAAGAAGMYVVLDLQPGRTDFLTQAEQYRSLLELPHVGLALDPEWRLQPGQQPLQQIGQVGVDEVNQVVTWLADLTRERALPQKLLVLHQFQVRMIIDRERLDTSRDELAIMVHADGQGGQPAKQGTWQVLHKNAPAPLYWGWKNFIDEDIPMLTPEQTIEQVLPTPELVTYQ
ncbi:hypothetical protein [Modestobacter sp. DSM 44400]|uniref:hypothetical protein n=1 Tax=Modestobacter sp. DSM 44400 TaxID=1550230 RepID=UPI0020C9247D|nr:hypothetical protein [Modestobacter sp. DSM 44400]